MNQDSDSETVTSIDENISGNNTSEILASGILHFFGPSVDQLTKRLQGLQSIQFVLSKQLDAIIRELHNISKAQRDIPEFVEKVKELINIKHKVTVITNILKSSQQRLLSLHSQIEREQLRRQAILSSPTQ